MGRLTEPPWFQLSGTCQWVPWSPGPDDPCSPGKALIRAAGGRAERQGSNLVQDENQGPRIGTELEQKVMMPFREAELFVCNK